MIEEWSTIKEFPNYSISSAGRVYNHRADIIMRTNPNNFGHMKITLTDESGQRHDRSVAKLVAEAFCVPPTELCDKVVVLDGDLTNLIAQNLVWRSSRFAWLYSRQLKKEQPIHYHNLLVRNVTTGHEYVSIIAAGMTEGLLFDDIWESTYRQKEVWPTLHIFEII